MRRKREDPTPFAGARGSAACLVLLLVFASPAGPAGCRGEGGPAGGADPPRELAADTPRMGVRNPEIAYVRIAGREVRVEVAADSPTRSRGLMGRTSLPPDDGMIFLFPDTSRHSFWMFDVAIPLSIAFIADSGEILDIQEMSPGAGIPAKSQPRYVSRAPVRIALEMRGGWFAAHGVRAGDRVDLGEGIRKRTAR